MADGRTRTLCIGVMQLGLALFLAASGIWAIQSYSGFFARAAAQFNGNEVAGAVYAVIKNQDSARLVITILGVIEILGGVFIVIDFFTFAIKGTGAILAIITILWIAVAILYDIVGYNGSGLLNGAFKSPDTMWRWFHAIGVHLIIIGGLLTISRGK